VEMPGVRRVVVGAGAYLATCVVAAQRGLATLDASGPGVAAAMEILGLGGGRRLSGLGG
jgi:hypothetical protein